MPRTPNRDTREEILEAAKALFIRYGFKKTTVDELAALARVGKPTIYSHFQNKDGVYIALVIREAENIRSAAWVAARHGKTAIQKAERMLVAAMEAIRENPMIQGVMEKDPDLVATHMQPVAEQIESAALEMVEELIQQGIREGSIRKVDPRLAAYTLYKIYQSFSYASTLPEETREPERARRFLVDFVKHGLLKEKTTKAKR